MTTTKPPHNTQMSSRLVRGHCSKLIHAAIFLLTTAAGAALIYSLQPPKPPKGQLLYDLFLFNSDTPVTDFSAQSKLMRLGANISVAGAPGPRIVGNLQLVTAEKSQTTLMIALGGSLPGDGFPQIGNVQINIVGEEARGKIHSKLEFKTGETISKHQFISGEEEVRVIQFDNAARPGHQYFYAIVRVQQNNPQPTPTRVISLPTRRQRTMFTPQQSGVSEQPATGPIGK